MRTRVGIFALSVVAALAVATGCHRDQDDATGNCFIVPGLYIYYPPIDLLVRDARGRGEALGDTAIAYLGADSTITAGPGVSDTLHLRAGDPQRSGTYRVRVKRRYYRDAEVSGIVVQPGSCGSVRTATVPVSLELLPDAPPLRAVQVTGAGFLYPAGTRLQLSARFDADPSVSTAVLWRLSDTTLARIDDSGMVTAKCSTQGGTITATALAVVDTLTRGSTSLTVGANATCP